MKIVIDIPKEVYEGSIIIKESRGIQYDDVIQIPLECIANGAVLSKNHGRLIDADALYKQDKEEWLCPNNAPFVSTDYAHVFAEIDNAPTIIKAESEGKE